MQTPPVLLPRPRRIELTQSTRGVAAGARPRFVIDPKTNGPQGYRLTIGNGQVLVIAGDEAGRVYAQRTLRQLVQQFPATLPAMEIEDWPDFPVRGVMLDISRDKVPTMATLFSLVDQLAELKINQLQLYTEHTFAYRAHETVWKDSSPMTAAEIRRLDAYCRERFIELVPNQNSFGHLERWLKHPQYVHLAECPDGFTFPWGRRLDSGFSVNPLDPRSIEFVEGLYDELLPNFSSGLFNVGCDETFDIGQGRSKHAAEKVSRERVYLDFLLKIHDAVKRRGRKMMFWGDIILHKPELLGKLPRDVIALNWGYEADHPFEKETLAFRDAGVPFYVCPGTSSWCSISGRTDNALANLRSAAEAGSRNGAVGYLNTDWGDYGHLQYLPISFLPLAAGAAYSWCYESNLHPSLHEAMDMHVFRDRAGVMGKLVAEFGNVHQAMKQPLANSTHLFWTLVHDPQRQQLWHELPIEEYVQAEERIAAAIAPLDRSQMDRPDAALICDETRNAAAMLRLACGRKRLLHNPSDAVSAQLSAELERIITEHRRLWLARNRAGGLSDSESRLRGG